MHNSIVAILGAFMLIFFSPTSLVIGQATEAQNLTRDGRPSSDQTPDEVQGATSESPLLAQKPSTATRDGDSVAVMASVAIANLQRAQQAGEATLIAQSELDPLIHEGGGGACPTAAAIDAIQVLRQMAGMNAMANPHRAVLEAFVNQPKLLHGRLTNEQFVRMIQFYDRSYLPDASIDVDVAIAPASAPLSTDTPWSHAEGPNLSLTAEQLKIITFTVTQASGELTGRHFVLLKDWKTPEMIVLDPARPTKDHRYTITNMLNGQVHEQRRFLLPPAHVPTRGIVNELDTIFTLTVRRALSELPEKTPSIAKSPGVEELKRQIDQTADELRATGELRSPRRWREESASYGLPGLDLPQELGGQNWSAANMLELFVHAGRHDLNCRDIVGGAHARPLLISQEPAVLDIVREVAAGRAYLAITLTEPHAGSDFRAMTSRAYKVAGGYRITGEKRYVARLEQATHVIIFTQPANGERKGLSAFVMPIDSPGMERYSFGAHGLKGNSFGGLILQDVFVPEQQMLGRDGEADQLFFRHFRYWRLMQVAAAMGTAERALEMMAERLSEREAYGGPIGRFTHLQQTLGQHTTELKMAKALAREAAKMLDRGEVEPADALINGLKAEGVEIALRAVDASMRAFGAEGYSDRVDLGDRLQDLTGLRIADGTTDVMRMDVVRRSYSNGNELWNMAVRGKSEE